MSVDLRKAIAAMFDIPAYRGSTRTGTQGKWWDADPEIASSFAHNPSGHGGTVIPGQLNTEGFLVIDAGGNIWDEIPASSIGDERILRHWTETMGYSTDESLPKLLNSDQIATAAEILGYPGVEFRNVFESNTDSPKLSTQYYVADPRRRRSRFAKFEDKDSEDIMASLLLTLMGGTAATTAAFNQDPNSDA